MNTLKQKRYLQARLILTSFPMMNIKLIAAAVLIAGFALVDILALNNLSSAYTRAVPLILALVLLLMNISSPANRAVKFTLYKILIVSIVLMMYVKVLMDVGDDIYTACITGVILVIFIASLEYKAGKRESALFFFAPFVIFAIALPTFSSPTESELIAALNILPITIMGYFANMIQNNLRMDYILSNYKLGEAKARVGELLTNMRSRNSELKALNKKLLQSEDQLRRSLMTKDKLFSVIAHDIRSPFSSIVGFSEFLSKDADKLTPVLIKRYSSEINKSSNKLLSFIDNLLNWSRSQSGDLKIEPQEIRLKLLTEEIISLFSSLAHLKNISVENHLTEDITIKADKDTISAVIRNVISNALKYTGEEGRITIRSDRCNGTFRMVIEDTGVGIKPEDSPKLFNLTDGFSTPGTNKEEGTGFGLIVCKEFMEQNGGDIKIESSYGKGTKVVLEFDNLCEKSS